MSDSLRPHGLQHARPPCPSPTPGVYSNSCPSSWWCHPTILSSVVPFSSCLQSFPASGSFPMSQFSTSGGQSIGVSASASGLPVIFRTDVLEDWLVWSPCSPRDSQESSSTPQFKSINSSERRINLEIQTCSYFCCDEHGSSFWIKILLYGSMWPFLLQSNHAQGRRNLWKTQGEGPGNVKATQSWYISDVKRCSIEFKVKKQTNKQKQ